ncbi:MAG: hypothetical protein OFPII_37500 [Osedax symbiont Rs1]|nr:MAG: hypothetical protein OFPII_37500 [Osedax symbiont Rs1]
MSSTKKPIIHLFTALSLALSLVSASTFATGNCRGESENACSVNDSCSWIKAHQRKDGANVKAYCRSKPQKNQSLISDEPKVEAEIKSQNQLLVKKTPLQPTKQLLITPKKKVTN